MRKLNKSTTLLIILSLVFFCANQSSNAQRRGPREKSDPKPAAKSTSTPSTKSSSVDDKNAADQTEMDKMIMAIQAGDIVKVKTALSKSPNIINQKDGTNAFQGQKDRDTRRTLIYYAVQSGQKEIALFLLSKGAKIMDPCDDHGTPILFGLVLKNYDMLKFLVANGVNIKQTDTDMNSVMHFLPGLGTNTVNLLIASGADVNAKNKFNTTPLHMIARSGYSGRDDVAEILIIKGADVNAKDKSGMTPLHLAAYSNGNKKLAIYLIEKGADLNAKDIKGQTPYSIAIKQRKTEMVVLLEEKGAK